MNIVLRGVRGGIASPTPDTAFYGGNTACVEVRTGNGTSLFMDAGTGLCEAGKGLPDNGEAHVFITHGHADHVVGLYFFKPIHSPDWTTHLYFPEWLDKLPDWFYRCGFVPVPFERLKGNVIRHKIMSGETLRLGTNEDPVLVDAFAVHHPGGGLGYRVRADNASFVYTGDHELMDDAGTGTDLTAILRGADLAVVDAQYTRKDYRPGFGHSVWEDWLDIARQSGVRQLVLTHHDIARSDAELHKLDENLRAARKIGQPPAMAAREGMVFTPGSNTVGLYSKHSQKDAEVLATIRLSRRKSDHLIYFLEALSSYRDKNSILDRVLAKAREITNADAGTIFLTEGEELVFAYTHNDSLFSADESHKHAYAAIRIPVSEDSIAGYVAATGKLLNLADVRSLPADAPYAFNDAFDLKTGFVTKSMLTLPFLGYHGKVLGVMQLINSLSPVDKTPGTFNTDMEQYCRLLAREVSGIIECSAMEKRGIFGIMRAVALHDPFETCLHAERVGAVTAELYHVWALNRGYDLDYIHHEKGVLRMASMLHDIGKAGVNDLILKKTGKLTDEEFVVTRGHTAIGASILAEDKGDIDVLAHDIALHHHQKWNGTGYAGSGDEGKLAGEDIPLGARITAVADVFDALVSPRCYKQTWTFDDALNLLSRESGAHFDPTLVESMIGIKELLRQIYETFPEKK